MSYVYITWHDKGVEVMKEQKHWPQKIWIQVGYAFSDRMAAPKQQSEISVCLLCMEQKEGLVSLGNRSL